MNSATTYKVIAIFVIMMSSLAGAMFPFIYVGFFSSKDQKHGSGAAGLDTEPLFFILKSLSCGVIIGVALLHLLPDSDETLADDFEYPVALAMAGLGVMICLSCEQFGMWLASTSAPAPDSHAHIKKSEYSLTESLIHAVDKENRQHGSHPDTHTNLAPPDEDENMEMEPSHHEDHSEHTLRTNPDMDHSSHSHVSTRSRSGVRRLSVEPDIDTSRGHSRLSILADEDGRKPSHRADSACEMGLIVHLLAGSDDDVRTLLKAYILEAAIAVHSIIMGVSLGSMGNSDVGSIKVLLIAYVIHQLLEGISLGCAISSTDLSTSKIAGLVIFFVCTLPMGIVIGICVVNGADDYVAGLVEGIANGIAAGILIYVSMVEILADEFAHDAVRTNYLLKVKMILAMTVGLGLMALLAQWA